MAYQDSNFTGTKTYCILEDSICVGDQIAFEQTTFTGSHWNARFAGFELVKGVILRESYGQEKQQHTFIVKLLPKLAELRGKKEMRIKGRNIYKNGVYRKKWKNESDRQDVLTEKRTRGTKARTARDERKGEYL